MTITLFDEILLEPSILTALSATGSPELANSIIKNPASGIYKTNITRYDPQLVVNVDINLVSPTLLEYFNQFWYGGWGSAYGFRFRWAPDFYVIGEVIGTGDGSNKDFYLTKEYNRPGSSRSYVRRIIKPVVNARLGGGGVTLYESNGTTTRAIPSTDGAAQNVPVFTVYKNTGGGAVAQTAYTIDNTNGKISFTVAPAMGAIISWSGEFDLPMCFNTNSYQQKPDISSEVTALILREVLPAELGILI